MRKSRNGCGWECCPSGFIEHIKNYKYQRDTIGVGFIEYWKWEIECFIGMHKAPESEDSDV